MILVKDFLTRLKKVKTLSDLESDEVLFIIKYFYDTEANSFDSKATVRYNLKIIKSLMKKELITIDDNSLKFNSLGEAILTAFLESDISDILNTNLRTKHIVILDGNCLWNPM